MSAQKNATTQRKDPYGNYKFRVEISGIAQTSFSEIILPDSASEVIEHREGTAANTQKQAGQASFGNLILVWGLSASMELYN